MLRRKLRNLVNGASAMRTTWREEPSFRIQIYVGVFLGALGWYFDITPLEWMFLILAITSVLTTELINTAIERIGNAFARENDPLIGLIKDLGAAAAGVVGIGAIAIVGIIFVPYFW